MGAGGGGGGGGGASALFPLSVVDGFTFTRSVKAHSRDHCWPWFFDHSTSVNGGTRV